MKEDFGREFKTWMSEDRNRNAGSRVKVREEQLSLSAKEKIQKDTQSYLHHRPANGFRCGTLILGIWPHLLISLRHLRSVVVEKRSY